MLAVCGRYSLEAKPHEIVEAFALADAIAFQARYNVAPTQDVPVVRAESARARTWHVIRWGLTPGWWTQPRPIINARCETVGRRFRRAFRERRCLVPATGFYEWQKLGGAKQPFHIRRRDHGLFAFAAIWDRYRNEEGDPVEACAILTTRPNRMMEPIHDRMPVILGPDAYPVWLDPDRDAEPLLGPAPEGLLEAYTVSRHVNTAANDDPQCVAPLATPEPPSESGTLWDDR